ncbi:hypothetical protein ACFQHO_53400 [Actinomadura yumaensis]|uniref:hypothetical protein n=1 Tax=Actinomadura yumaensis TaxID=111807 RepID=UPI00361A774E
MTNPLRDHLRAVLLGYDADNQAVNARAAALEAAGRRVIEGGRIIGGDAWRVTAWRTGEVLAEGTTPTRSAVPPTTPTTPGSTSTSSPPRPASLDPFLPRLARQPRRHRRRVARRDRHPRRDRRSRRLAGRRGRTLPHPHPQAPHLPAGTGTGHRAFLAAHLEPAENSDDPLLVALAAAARAALDEHPDNDGYCTGCGLTADGDYRATADACLTTTGMARALGWTPPARVAADRKETQPAH